MVNATPRPLYPQERPGADCTGGWVDPRAGLDGCGKSRPHRDSIPGPSSPYESLYRLSSPDYSSSNNNNNNNKCCGIKKYTQTEKLTANRPDIKIKNKKEKTLTLIQVAIPTDRNIVQKNVEELKYKSLCIEIQRMWNLKCTIIPVIIGATGIVTRSLRKHLEAVQGKHSIDSLQKTAILGTSHILRKVLQCEA